MEQQNGYFQITWNDTTAVCHLFAPKAKGVPVSYKELASFLDDHGVIGYKEKEISDAIAKDMKKRGFKFFGSTICYAHMQATGMVNDHIIDCSFR